MAYYGLILFLAGLLTGWAIWGPKPRGFWTCSDNAQWDPETDFKPAPQITWSDRSGE